MSQRRSSGAVFPSVLLLVTAVLGLAAPMLMNALLPPQTVVIAPEKTIYVDSGNVADGSGSGNPHGEEPLVIPNATGEAAIETGGDSSFDPIAFIHSFVPHAEVDYGLGECETWEDGTVHLAGYAVGQGDYLRKVSICSADNEIWDSPEGRQVLTHEAGHILAYDKYLWDTTECQTDLIAHKLGASDQIGRYCTAGDWTEADYDRAELVLS